MKVDGKDSVFFSADLGHLFHFFLLRPPINFLPCGKGQSRNGDILSIASPQLECCQRLANKNIEMNISSWLPIYRPHVPISLLSLSHLPRRGRPLLHPPALQLACTIIIATSSRR